jgi:hypothetical protein
MAEASFTPLTVIEILRVRRWLDANATAFFEDGTVHESPLNQCIRRLLTQTTAMPALYGALKALHDDCVEYSQINNLGAEDNAVLVAARVAMAKVEELKPPKFAETFCSQCGGAFGPGDSGFSHCSDHRAARGE